MKELSNNVLKSLNITETQAKVYVAALELGQATIQHIAKKSGVKRTTIYHFLDELKARGFLQETKKKKRLVFSATSPVLLVELEKNRLAELENALPELEAIENSAKKKPRITFYEGVDGIKEVYADCLRDKKPMQVIGDFEHSPKVMGQQYIEYFVSERVKRQIPYNAILRDSETAREWAKRNTRDLREAKLLPKGDFATEVILYGNKVALMSFRNDPPFVVVVEDKDIAETFRTMWESLWERMDIHKAVSHVNNNNVPTG